MIGVTFSTQKKPRREKDKKKTVFWTTKNKIIIHIKYFVSTYHSLFYGIKRIKNNSFFYPH